MANYLGGVALGAFIAFAGMFAFATWNKPAFNQGWCRLYYWQDFYDLKKGK